MQNMVAFKVKDQSINGKDSSLVIIQLIQFKSLCDTSRVHKGAVVLSLLRAY